MFLVYSSCIYHFILPGKTVFSTGKKSKILVSGAFRRHRCCTSCFWALDVWHFWILQEGLSFIILNLRGRIANARTEYSYLIPWTHAHPGTRDPTICGANILDRAAILRTRLPKYKLLKRLKSFRCSYAENFLIINSDFFALACIFIAWIEFCSKKFISWNLNGNFQ